MVYDTDILLDNTSNGRGQGSSNSLRRLLEDLLI